MTSNCFESRIRHYQIEDAHHTPKEIRYENFAGESVSRETLLGSFSDAEAAENLTQQVVCCKFTSNTVECFLCLAEFLSKQLGTLKLLCGFY
jgi:hypothetical protein